MNIDPIINNKINSIIELFSNGQLTEALKTVEALISQYPNEPILHNISGVCYQETGQLEMAVQSFERAVAIKPDFADAHYNLGLSLQELNQLDAAVKSYEDTLAIESEYVKAYNNLGIIFIELGHADDAIKAYEQVIAIEPNNAQAHHNLGNALNELGKLDEAIKSYKQALSIEPNYYEAHNNLGTILFKIGQTDEALNSYKDALSINPDFTDAHNNIGITLQSLGQFDEASESYEKAIAINNEHTQALNNLGNCNNECGQFAEAVNFYRQALNINPNFEDAYYNLGTALYALGQNDNAINSYNNLLSINPDYADAHNNLGLILQELGQSDEAFNAYVNALAIEPNNAQFHRNLSTLKKYKEGDTQLAQMQSLLSKSNIGQKDCISLSFALSKAYGDLGKVKELFKVLNEGNLLRKEELNYSIESDLNKHAIFRKLFKSATTKSSSYDSQTSSPIFIVGMPRSGTSLVEQIISSHHKVHGAGELPNLDKLITPIFNEYLSNNNALSEKNFLSIRQGYLQNLSSLNVPERIITDKMPTNFENIGFILKAFPEAKIIHLKRDSMAVCWSIYQRYFPAKNLGFPYNMKDLAQFYNSYSLLMEFWHELFPNQIYDISYEDLTTNQEEETRKLLEYCGLDWDQDCLNFYTNKSAVKTASSLQVKEPMYQGSSEKWKKYKAHLKPLINTLGYPS